MKPDVDRTLQILSATLLAEVAPRLSGDYEQKSLAMSAMLLQLAAEEWDRGAARRVEENRALREIFREASAVVAGGDLAKRLAAATETTDDSLRVRDLDRSNATLRQLLIELHTQIETLESPEAHRLDERIWVELRDSTERRRLALAPF